MPTVSLATSDHALHSPVDADGELWPIAAALHERGVEPVVADWRSPDADWAASDLVVVKSPWDYAGRREEFLDWLARVEAVAPVVNHPEVIRWSLDKAYLRELAARGVAVCPTHYASTPEDLRARLVAASGRVVVKPTVSAGSADTGLFEAGHPGAEALGRRILDLGKVVMIQPAIPSVADVGERALVFVGGRFEHAVRKGPLLALGGGLLGGEEYAETITGDVAPDDELALAEAALAAATTILAERGVPGARAGLVQARVDIARDPDDRPVLLELELFEPSCFLHLVPGGEHRYAEAVTARLDGALG